MEKKIRFTNESLSKNFTSNFELVNYAIRLAENMIKSGRDTRVKSDIQNRAMLILEEIYEGKDIFDEIKEVSGRLSHNNETHPHEYIHEEKTERRKYRTAGVSFDDEI
ncbi:DNA-directed RNA polymerase subunit omega [Candidatus Protochlamydia sp. R18]|uniref:DNA-directed RNA polymerase subunit omega n=1 Tax=Candidatus Protochlamydia sp. R18 TaxID=1353977 RepID=UPI0005A80CF2|nr:DNA-directed RNA polymerase subunit omega [Candidatus Protochlamydia sp. R18]